MPKPKTPPITKSGKPDKRYKPKNNTPKDKTLDVKELITTSDKTPDQTLSQLDKIDIEKALKLRILNNYTYQQIGDYFGVSKQSAHERLRKFTKFIEDPTAIIAYRDNKGALLEAVELELLVALADPGRLQKATTGNVAYAIDKINNALRLERNQPTAHVEVHSIVAAIKADDAKCKPSDTQG